MNGHLTEKMPGQVRTTLKIELFCTAAKFMWIIWLQSIKFSFLLILSFEMACHPHMILPIWISPLFLSFFVNLCHLTSPSIELRVILHAICKGLKKLNFSTCSNFPRYFLSQMAIHPYVLYMLKKPFHQVFQHTKYEPDTSRHASNKWGVKITVTLEHPVLHNFF